MHQLHSARPSLSHCFPPITGRLHILWNISRTFMRWNFRQAEELGRAAMLKPDTCGNMW